MDNLISGLVSSAIIEYLLAFLILFVAVFIMDQSTKGWVRGNMYLGESAPPTGFFRITHTYNTGSAFGLFPGQTFLLMRASLAGIGILLFYFRNQPIPPLWLRTSLGLQLGGAAGNLVDRITLGHVTDFIDVGAWPVFNLADSSILVGIAILAWFMWQSPRAPARPKGEASAEDSVPLPATPQEPAEANSAKEEAPALPVSSGPSQQGSEGRNG